MEFSTQPVKIQNEDGRWFMVVSRVEGGFLARDSVTSDLVYMKHSDIAGGEKGAQDNC
jgi:hypothetical protein